MYMYMYVYVHTHIRIRVYINCAHAELGQLAGFMYVYVFQPWRSRRRHSTTNNHSDNIDNNGDDLHWPCARALLILLSSAAFYIF